jgi:hypothetical protein
LNPTPQGSWAIRAQYGVQMPAGQNSPRPHSPSSAQGALRARDPAGSQSVHTSSARKESWQVWSAAQTLFATGSQSVWHTPSTHVCEGAHCVLV